jgi:hypothetical protein
VKAATLTPRPSPMLFMAKRLHRASPNTGKRRSFHKISAEIAATGLLNDRGNRVGG